MHLTRFHGVFVVMTNGLRRISAVRNLFIRNGKAGLAVSRGPSAEEPHDPIVIDSNDFIGNDPESGCGLWSGVEGEPIYADNNFWAAAPDFDVTRQTACAEGSAAIYIDPRRLQPH